MICGGGEGGVNVSPRFVVKHTFNCRETEQATKGGIKIKSTAPWHQLPKHMNGGKMERRKGKGLTEWYEILSNPLPLGKRS